MEIKKISIVGMGALGILFGNYFTEKLGREVVSFILNKDRIEKYNREKVTCNGKVCDFKVIDEDEKGEIADLLIMAVKGTCLAEGIKTARNHVGENTLIISVLNGISSEEVIGAEFGKDKVLYCVAQGMDAVKIKNNFTYSNFGELRIGIPKDEEYKRDKLNSVVQLFDRINFPYTLEDDIIHRIWSKFMLNVGINQTVMIFEGTYGTVQKSGRPREIMINAMKEVIELASYENVKLTEDDLNGYLNLVDTLQGSGMPSMRQDGLAHRYSEVELFSGTVLRLAEKHGLSMKTNEFLYNRIKEIERSYNK